nr:hypothetical protein [Tanacetum cinerariifolium]
MSYQKWRQQGLRRTFQLMSLLPGYAAHLKRSSKGNQGEPLNAWWSSHLNDLMEKETICSEVIVIKRKIINQE